jgi:hypothetical protein
VSEEIFNWTIKINIMILTGPTHENIMCFTGIKMSVNNEGKNFMILKFNALENAICDVFIPPKLASKQKM